MIILLSLYFLLSVYNDLLMIFFFVIKIQFRLNYFLLRKLLQAGSGWLVHEVDVWYSRFWTFCWKTVWNRQSNNPEDKKKTSIVNLSATTTIVIDTTTNLMKAQNVPHYTSLPALEQSSPSNINRGGWVSHKCTLEGSICPACHFRLPIICRFLIFSLFF